MSRGRVAVRATALIAAAGKGERMGAPLPKQFLPVGGVPLLVHALRPFEKVKEVTEVFLIIPPGKEDYCQREIVEKYALQKVTKLIVGGQERQESVSQGLGEVSPSTEVVVVHDGVRPCVTEDMIRDAIRVAGMSHGAVVGIPVSETVKETTLQEGRPEIIRTLDRSRLWLAQTPQAFPLAVLVEAHEKARHDAFTGTDEASLVERLGYHVIMVMGSPFNMKVTTPQDLILAEQILEESAKNCEKINPPEAD